MYKISVETLEYIASLSYIAGVMGQPALTTEQIINVLNNDTNEYDFRNNN